jgi:hypothetical protein
MGDKTLMEIILIILGICVLSYLLRPFELVWWLKPIIHGAAILFVIILSKKDKLRGEEKRREIYYNQQWSAKHGTQSTEQRDRDGE